MRLRSSWIAAFARGGEALVAAAWHGPAQRSGQTLPQVPSRALASGGCLRLLWLLWLFSLISLFWLLCFWPAGPAAAQAPASVPSAQEPSDAQAPQPVRNSALDAPLFYQLLVAEIELRNGRPAVAFEVVLDAARRRKDEQLFRRAADIALQARAGDRALAAVQAWRGALPQSLEAVRLQLQILAALNRPQDAAEPLRLLIEVTPADQRAALIASVPRLFQRASDGAAVARLLEESLRAALQAPATRGSALVALARAWAQAGELDRALGLLQQAQSAEPDGAGAVMLALELIARTPAAEAIVQAHLRRADADPALRLAYARALMQSQRYGDALAQVEQVTRTKPDLAPAWLMLGALQVELRLAEAAEQALQRYLRLAAASATPPAARRAPAPQDGDEDDDAEEAGNSQDASMSQAWLLLSQAAEQRRDFAAAEAYLARIDNPRRMLEVQTRRATLMARQGQLEMARELIRRLPQRDDDEARARLVAEAQVLREVRRWAEAFEVLGGGVARWPRDADLAYEQAMMAEKLGRLDEMERLLRGVIALRPDHPHAYNALGYSLADRGQRLPEARALIARALELAPGDPFITDSLGWVEFRLGRLEEALRLLRQAYTARPDTEIAAHLGEVLWVLGRQDEARQVWREGRGRDADNEVLRETLARLNPGL